MKCQNVIFFGEDVFSLTVLKSIVDSQLKLRILGVVIIEPISVSGHKLVGYCASNKIPVFEIKNLDDPDFLNFMRAHDYDFLVTAHFQRIIPESLFCRAAIAALNLHPSLLPKYRGMSPQHWPIYHGDDEMGVTVHLMEKVVDTGNIIARENITLGPDIYIHQLQKKMLSVYRHIMVRALKLCLEGYEGEVQSDSGASYYGKIRASDMDIDINESFEDAYNKIRSFSMPYSGATFKDKTIFRAERVSNSEWEALVAINGIGYCEHHSGNYLLFSDGGLKIL